MIGVFNFKFAVTYQQGSFCFGFLIVYCHRDCFLNGFPVSRHIESLGCCVGTKWYK